MASRRFGDNRPVTTRALRPAGPAARGRYAASKVPQITALFWLIKILTTAMGEAAADFLAFRYGPIPTGVIGTVVFAAALALQFRARRYRAWIYWLAVSMVAVYGTMLADGLHIVLGVPYLLSSVFFAVALTVVFVTWYAVEGTLSIHSITTPRREVFYWAAVCATFAMGTAVGDLTAVPLGLGFLASGVLFTAAFAVPGLAYWTLRRGAVLAFWTAYVLTRPLGASYADWLGVAPAQGGLGLGRGTVAVALAAVIAVLVGYLAHTRRDVDRGTAAPARARHRR